MTQDPSSICTFPLLWDLGFSKPLTEKGEMRTLWATCHLGSSVAAVKRPSLKEYLSRFANQKDAKGCKSPQTTRPHLLMQYSQKCSKRFLAALYPCDTFGFIHAPDFSPPWHGSCSSRSPPKGALAKSLVNLVVTIGSRYWLDTVRWPENPW